MALRNKPFQHKFSKTLPFPSPIQTILSALDSHQILPFTARGLRIVAFITADWEFHPTPKENNIKLMNKKSGSALLSPDSCLQPRIESIPSAFDRGDEATSRGWALELDTAQIPRIYPFFYNKETPADKIYRGL